MMTVLNNKQVKLLKDLEDVRSDMETLLDENTLATFPKAFRRIKDSFDTVIQGVEDGEYQESEESETE